MEESFSSEHSSELFTDSLEHLLDGSGVSEECNWHLKSFWWDITDWRFNVVWNPFNEIRRVLILDVKHLLINFLGGHSSSEHGWGSKISSVSWIRSAHHVLGIEHLLSELWDSEGSVLLGSSWGKGSESSHEEMKSWEWNKIYCKFSQVRVKLTWESKTACNSWKSSWDQVVKISISWSGELKSSEANIIKGFIINAHNLIGVLDKLMDWKSSIVWLNDGIWDLWGWHNWESDHLSIWIFFSDLWDKESSHSWSSTSSERVGDLETLKTIATFSFFSNDIENWINEFSSFSVMTFSPVVTSSSLSENEVVWSEELTEWSSSDWIHGSWFEIHEDSSWNVSSSSGFIEVDIDSFKLKIWVSVISTGGVNSMFVRDDFPEFSSDLVTALTTLDVNDFSHFKKFFLFINYKNLNGTTLNSILKI